MQSYLRLRRAQHNPALRELDVLKCALETPHPCGHWEKAAVMKFPSPDCRTAETTTFLGSCEPLRCNQEPVALRFCGLRNVSHVVRRGGGGVSSRSLMRSCSSVPTPSGRHCLQSVFLSRPTGCHQMASGWPRGCFTPRCFFSCALQ